MSVPVLSTTSVSTFSIRSMASASLISTPACAPRPTPTMMDIGVASPSAHGQAMISTATALTIAWAKRGSGPTDTHATKVRSAIAITAGTNQPATLSAETLNRRAAALRLRDHLDDLREHGFAADAFGLHEKAAGAIDRAAGDFVAACLLDRHRLAGEHRFIDARLAIDDAAIHRHFLAGTHAQLIAALHFDRAALRVPRHRERHAQSAARDRARRGWRCRCGCAREVRAPGRAGRAR